MKTIKNTFTLIAVFLFALFSFADSILDKGDYVEILNESGEILYSGRVTTTGSLTKVFNFSKLNDGQYTVEISKDFLIEINTVEVKDNIAKVLIDTTKKVHKPVFRTENEKVFISKINSKKGDVIIELFYEDELIYAENIGNSEPVIRRTFRLDDTKKGNYTAIIKTIEREFTEYFEL